MFGDDVPRNRIHEVYLGTYPLLVRYAARLQVLIRQLCDERGIVVQAIEARAKEPDHLGEKLNRYPDLERLSDVTDLCGVRVVTYYLKDVTAVRDMLADEFSIVWEEPRGAATPDAFGYRSLHMVGHLSDERAPLTEFRSFADFQIEFQIRTVLQHAWGVISHSLDYKNETQMPAEVRRMLFRVAALLETGDELFGLFRDEVESVRARYDAQARRENWQELPINLDSVIAAWRNLPLDNVVNLASEAGFEMVATHSSDEDRQFRISVTRLVSLLTATGGKNLNDLAVAMKDVERERHRLSLLAIESKRRGFEPVGDPIDIVMLSLFLHDPYLRVRCPIPFRKELEDALDTILASEGEA